MSNNSERIAAELAELRYRTSPFTAPQQQGGADGVRFQYRIEDGSRAGETVILAVAMHQNEGEWPEVAPHWLYLSPPDPVLAELVKGSAPRAPSRPSSARTATTGWRSALRRATSGIRLTPRKARTWKPT